MDTNIETSVNKKGPNKLIAIIIAAAVLLLGGSVAAYVLFDNNTPKADYFIYEKNTMDLFADQFKERFSSELEWSEATKEKPTENTYELSAEVNMPLSDGTGYITPEQIINNSTLTLTTQLDRKEKLATAELKGGFGNFTIEDINFYLTSEKIMFGLPFVKEVLQLKGEDFGKLAQQFDPMTFTGEEKIDFNMFFEGNVIAEKDAKYIEDEYVKFMYDSIPEDAFEATEETVKVNDDSVDTEKITFHLTEEQIKKILEDTVTKMAKDEKLKGIITDYMVAQGTGPFDLGANSALGLPNFEEEYDTVMQEILDGLDDFRVPNGFTSTIWVNDKVIVKRDFTVEMGPTEDELIEFYVTGNLKLDKTDLSFAYDLGFVEQGFDESITLEGNLSNDKGKIADKITVSIPDGQLIYQSDETVKDKNKDFKRTFSLVEGTGYQVDLIWSGDAEYNGDQMKSSHEITFAADDLMEDSVILHVNRDAKVIDKIDFPKEDEVKDIGSMSANDLMMYFESEVSPQFEEWMMGIMGFGF